MTVIIVVVGIIGLALTFWYAVNWHGFLSDYRFHGEFQGQRYDCTLRFANAETGCRCMVGANESGLFLLSDPEYKRSWRRSMFKQLSVPFDKNLQISWSDLQFRAGKMFLKECIWFDVPARNVHFFVPKDVGDKLLLDGKQAIAANHN